MRRRALILLLACLALIGADLALLWRRARDRNELERLRQGMTALERQRADAVVAADAERSRLLMALLRQQLWQQALGDGGLHLVVSVDSSYAALDRGRARLRQFPVEIGPDRRVGVAPDTVRVVAPRGMRRVERVLSGTVRWEPPAWLWADRGLAPPAETAPGWAGPIAVVTTGGVLLYTLPAIGPLADHGYLLPGAIRIAAADMRALRESLKPGMAVYFY
jgi:hypothetical protein